MSSKKPPEIPARLSQVQLDGPVVRWTSKVNNYLFGTAALSWGFACYFIGFSAWWLLLALPVSSFIIFTLCVTLSISRFVPYSVRLAEIEDQVKRPWAPKSIVREDGPRTTKELTAILDAQKQPDMDAIRAAGDAVTEFIEKVSPLCTDPLTSESAISKVIDAIKLLEDQCDIDYPEWVKIETSNPVTFDFVSGEKLTVPTSCVMLNRDTRELEVFKLEPGWENGKVISAEVLQKRITAYNCHQFLVLPTELTDADGNTTTFDATICFVL